MVIKHTRVIDIPASLAEADDSLSRMTALDLELAKSDQLLKTRIAKLRTEAREKSAELRKQRNDLQAGLEAWAKYNYQVIVNADGKSIRLTHGTIGFRYGPPKVEVGRGGDEKAIAALKKSKRKDCIRTRESLNRQALLENRPNVRGIKYVQYERCFIRPDAPVITKLRDPLVRVSMDD